MFQIISRNVVDKSNTVLGAPCDSATSAVASLQVEACRGRKRLVETKEGEVLPTDCIVNTNDLKVGQEYAVKNSDSAWSIHKITVEAGYFSGATSEVVAEVGLLSQSVAPVSQFLEDVEDKEEAADDAKESAIGLAFIQAYYANEQKVCMPFNTDAVKVGDYIRKTLTSDDHKRLIEWCTKLNAESGGMRSDVQSLLGYVNRWVLKNWTVAERHFRMAIAAKNPVYPLAMVNLFQYGVSDGEALKAEVKALGYIYSYTQ